MGSIEDFLGRVIATYKTGNATEHSYRPALQSLFNSLTDGVTALNEPKRVDCGAPDFIIQRGEIAIGHAEAKDISVGLRGMKDANKNQQERYRKALPNLIYTNCLDWDFYRNGELVASVTIADYLLGIQPKPEKYSELENLLRQLRREALPAPASARDASNARRAGRGGGIRLHLWRAALPHVSRNLRRVSEDRLSTHSVACDAE